MAFPPFPGQRIEPPGGSPPNVRGIIEETDRISRGLLRLQRDPGPVPILSADLVAGLRDGDPQFEIPWVDLTDELDLGNVNATSAAANDPGEPFSQIVGNRGAARTFGLADLQRPIPLFATAAARPQAPGRAGVITGTVRGGAENWIERVRRSGDNLPEGYPDRRAAAATEYVALNLSDVLRPLVARSRCIHEEPNRLVFSCHYPTMDRRGDRQLQRYWYALNAMASQGGLQPGAQLDVSFLIQVQRELGLDFLLARVGGADHAPAPLDVDGIFAGAGIMSNDPGPWPMKIASIFTVAAGDVRRIVDPNLAATPGSTFADGGRANVFVSAGLRTLTCFRAGLPAGALARHPVVPDAEAERSLVDGLDVQGVRDVLRRDDADRAYTIRELQQGRNLASGQRFRLTLSIASLPVDAWTAGGGQLEEPYRFRYALMAALRRLRQSPTNEERWDTRVHVFKPSGYFKPPIADDVVHRGPIIVESNSSISHWITSAGELGLVVGGFSHSPRRGAKLRWTLESIHARHYFRGIPQPMMGGRFLHPG